ncbi:MAG: Gfo/Idh/MocA family oxidoreductase [Lentilitoribacter sp.]
MNNNEPARIVVVGAGLIGERHAKLVARHTMTELAAIVDPAPQSNKLADELGCKKLNDISEIAMDEIDGAIIATPNANHLKSGLFFANKNIPCLIEKPIADNLKNAELLASEFDKLGVPLLIGHHRRYHPFVDRTKEIIEQQELGVPVMASIIWAVRKPDDYFEKGAWRTKSDGGPLLINFIHEADLLLHIFGKVIEIQAMTSNFQRGQAVEDTAGVLLRFESGLMASVILSDAALTPWSFEGACSENPNIAGTGISSWRIGCAQGALEFPQMNVWIDKEDQIGDWSRPLKSNQEDVTGVEPLYEQLTHFTNLIRRTETKAKCDGWDGIQAMRLIDLINQSVEPLSSLEQHVKAV